jgi:hypothetical protein
MTDALVSFSGHVALNSYPIGIGVGVFDVALGAVMAAVRGAEPSVSRSVADRCAAA